MLICSLGSVHYGLGKAQEPMQWSCPCNQYWSMQLNWLKKLQFVDCSVGSIEGWSKRLAKEFGVQWDLACSCWLIVGLSFCTWIWWIHGCLEEYIAIANNIEACIWITNQGKTMSYDSWEYIWTYVLMAHKSFFVIILKK